MSSICKSKNRLEGPLVEAVVDFLTTEGYNIRVEVPTLGQCADLVATRGRWVTFVEVKVRDWRRAFRQCHAHTLVADFICIAVGTKEVSASLRHAASERGIGVIHIPYNGTCQWIIRPTLNESVWRPQRRQLSQVLRAMQHVS